MNKKLLKTIWSQSEKFAAIVSIIFSALALVISIRSCRQSEYSLRLAEQEFESQRLAIWRGIVNNVNDELLLSAIDDQISMQQAIVLFSPEVDSTKWPVGPPRYRLPLVVLRNRMQKIIAENIPKKTGYVSVGSEKFIPIVIESNYVAKGNFYFDRSLYYIQFLYVISDDELKPPNIEFNGLVFGSRLNPQSDIKEILREEWKKCSGITSNGP